MKEIKIIAKSKTGEEALDTHIKESLKTRLDKKLIMKQLGIVQSVICKDPLTLLVEFRNKRLQKIVQPNHIALEIKEALQKNGAYETKDYEIEVI